MSPDKLTDSYICCRFNYHKLSRTFSMINTPLEIPFVSASINYHFKIHKISNNQ